MQRHRQENRQRDFKKCIAGDDARRKREDMRLSLRKAKRDEQIQKRRHVGASAASGDDSLSAGGAAGTAPSLALSLDTLPSHVQGLLSADPSANMDAVVALRKMLSVEKNPPISQVVAMGAVPRLVEFLAQEGRSKLQFEAAWALTNIASGTTEQCHALIEHGAVQHFVNNMLAHDPELREQCVWALGNIAGDSPTFRDFCMAAGMLHPLLTLLMDVNSSESMRHNGIWALSNLCRGKPQPDFANVRAALPVLAQLIQSDDKELVTDSLWALSYLSDGPNSNVAEVVNSGIAPKLVHLLASDDYTIQTPALRTVGNIVTGSDESTQAMLDAGALWGLSALLRSERKTLRKEAAWAISNITAGNVGQTTLAFGISGLVSELIHLLGTGDFDVRKECVWAISNATTWKDPSQIRSLVRAGVIAPLCDMLKAGDAKVIEVTLEAMNNILFVGHAAVNEGKSHQNEFYETFDEAEAIDRLEELQDHESEKIYKFAVQILEDFFEAADGTQENAGPNMTPQVASGGNQFAFAAPAFGLNNQQQQQTNFAF